MNDYWTFLYNHKEGKHTPFYLGEGVWDKEKQVVRFKHEPYERIYEKQHLFNSFDEAQTAADEINTKNRTDDEWGAILFG